MYRRDSRANAADPTNGDHAATDQLQLHAYQGNWIADLALLVAVFDHANSHIPRGWIWHRTWVQFQQSIYPLEMSRREVASSPLLTRLHHRHARVIRTRSLASVLPRVVPLSYKPSGLHDKSHNSARGQPRCIPVKRQTMKNAQPRLERLLSVRVTAEQFAYLQEQATAANVELSLFVRSLLLDPKAPERRRAKTVNAALLGTAIASINKVGGLLNQIAKQANINGDLSAFRDAQQDRARLAEAVRAVMAALGDSGR